MKMMRVTSLVSLLTMVCLVSCGSPQPTQRGHEVITEARALEMAMLRFGKTRRKATDYGVTMDTDSTGQKWIVWFEKKGTYATTGSKHAVTVEKATGRTVFMQGE